MHLFICNLPIHAAHKADDPQHTSTNKPPVFVKRMKPCARKKGSFALLSGRVLRAHTVGNGWLNAETQFHQCVITHQVVRLSFFCPSTLPKLIFGQYSHTNIEETIAGLGRMQLMQVDI